MKKTHWKKMTNPDYLGAYDFDVDEKSRVLTIKHIVQEKIKGTDGKSEECVIAHFTEGKPMILNKTNMKAITIAHKSPYVEDWSGKTISVHVEKVRAFGEIVDALRVDTKAPQQTSTAKVSNHIILKKDDDNWSKVISYVKANSGSKPFEKISQDLEKKYKMSPTISKSLRSVYEESK
jgi:hypothetical protein